MNDGIAHRVGNLVAVRMLDRMIDRRTRELSRMLAASISAAGGPVRLLLTVDGLSPSRSPENLFENLHFVRLHAENIERLAIVGNRGWERTSIGLFGLFGGIETAYFDRSQGADAVRWLQGGGDALRIEPALPARKKPWRFRRFFKKK